MTDSLTITDEQSEAVRVAPRITKAFIESQLAKIIFFTGDVAIAGGEAAFERGLQWPWKAEALGHALDEWQEEFAHHTYCILQTNGGFSVTGHSAPASPDNFNAELGRQFAYENAFRQLWPLFAFALLTGDINAEVAQGF